VAVRCGLPAAIEAADADSAIDAVLIVGAGRNSIGGATLRTFEKEDPRFRYRRR
jgi:3-hydroxyacyl-CoA dehydrogenase